MTSKEFDLFLALILSLLKRGDVDEVIRLIEEARNNNPKKED